MNTQQHIERHLHSFLLTASVAFAPSAWAQMDCNDLSITSVRYAAFADTALEVEVLNAGPSFFSYPSFSMVNTALDTIARESVTWFGIGEGGQRHRMDLLPGATLPGTPFTGELLLTFYDLGVDSVCVFPMNAEELCPSTTCNNLLAYAYTNVGSVTTDFSWSITDTGSNVVGSGLWHFETGVIQYGQDSLCLPPGEYVMHIDQPTPTAGEFTFGVRQDNFVSNGIEAIFAVGGMNHLPFTFYGPCMEGANAIEEVQENEFLLNVQSGMLHIGSPDGRVLGTVEVLDAHGRPVARMRTFGSSTILNMNGHAMGIYFVLFPDHHDRPAQRFIFRNDL